MIKILLFSLSSNVMAASACAAIARASGHKARAVDATLLTKSDAEAAHVVITHAESEDLVRAAYGNEMVLVMADFNPTHFMPEPMAAIEAWARGDAEAPSFDAAAPAANGDPEAQARVDALKAALTEKGIKFRANASEAKLQEMLDAAAPAA